MALVLKDRVVESSTSSGTGTFTLNGAELGYQSFAAIGDGNTTYYTIEHPQTGEWEVGVGTYNAGTLSRDTVLSSSNSGALVYFSSGQKNVFVDLPSEKVPTALGDVVGPASATNDAIARFDGTTGKLIQNSAVTIDDAGNIAGADSLLFSGTVPAVTTAPGTMWFDNATDTLNFQQNNITQQIGEELFVYGRADEAITDGQVVAVTGSYGTTGTVRFAPAPAGLTDDSVIIGIATESIPKNGFGRITCFGTVHGLNTTGFADGDVIWYDPTVVGGYTKTKPTAPNVKCQVGIITKAAGGTNGSLAVEVIHGTSLGGTDSNVNITSVADQQLLQYYGAGGYWRNVSTIANTLITGLGTMSTQNANSVSVTGGSIDGTAIGATTASTGKFTSVTTPSVTASATDLTLSAISTGAVKFSTAGGLQGQFNNTASTVNYFDMFGSPTTKAIQFKSNGFDTNISMAFQPKGTGAIDLAAGSSGVNISNGGTVTAITRTASGSGYTSIPTIAITAPTTAGGVQATASVATMQIGTATIVSGGTGYTVNDVLTLVGGTPSGTTATLTVSSVSAGVITAVTISYYGNYSALPTNPVSVTGGTGSGATFNIAYAVLTYTITNAGSGYIEQPTVSFSGGGGSGASAYATVGSGTVVKGLATDFKFNNPSGTCLWLLDGAVATPNPLVVVNKGNPWIYPANTNSDLIASSNGTGAVRIFTATVGNEQARFSHTASAVNYVQVTGSATGGNPAISVQGSDATRGLSFTVKGLSNFNFYNNNGSNQTFAISGNAGTIANYLQATSSIAGVATSLQALGTDTNINLALTPKGTGTVQFGTYTAGVLTPTGYITITDAGGTTRRLLVG